MRKPQGLAAQHSVRLLNAMSRQARRALATPDVDAVHDLRISIRRLMAALDLFDSGLGKHGGRKIRKRVKKLLELAGAARDCDVASKYISKLEAPPELLSAVQAQRNEVVKALLAGLQERIEKHSVAKWRRKLLEAPADGKVERAARKMVQQMIAEFMTRGKRAANPHASGRQLHHFRLAAKSLHYALELPVAPARSSWMDDAKAVQKLVGEIHDCEAVRALVQPLPMHEGVVKELRKRQHKKRVEFREMWNARLASRPVPVVRATAQRAKAPRPARAKKSASAVSSETIHIRAVS